MVKNTERIRAEWYRRKLGRSHPKNIGIRFWSSIPSPARLGCEESRLTDGMALLALYVEDVKRLTERGEGIESL